MGELWALFLREIELAFAQGGQVANGLVFFLCLIVTVTFGLGPDGETLQRVGPAILWTGPLLAVLLGVPQLFQPDAEDGVLDVYRAATSPMELIVLVKAAAYVVSFALPLVAAAPLFGLLLNMPGEAIVGCALCLLVGAPALACVGAFAGALTVAVRRAGMLATILATPLLVPVMVFGVSASVAFADPAMSFRSPFLYLLACDLFFAVICAVGGAAAIRAAENA